MIMILKLLGVFLGISIAFGILFAIGGDVYDKYRALKPHTIRWWLLWSFAIPASMIKSVRIIGVRSV